MAVKRGVSKDGDSHEGWDVFGEVVKRGDRRRESCPSQASALILKHCITPLSTLAG